MAEIIRAPKASPIPPQLRKEVADIYLSRWWVKVLLATEQDKLGLVLRAAMAFPSESPPWLGPSAIIDDKGMVLSNWVDEHNHMHFAAAVCTIDELVGNARRLCDALKLNRAEAEALFAKLREWIKNDARPTTEQPEDRIPIEYRQGS